jgi:hypothetical protein
METAGSSKTSTNTSKRRETHPPYGTETQKEDHQIIIIIIFTNFRKQPIT